MPTVENPFPLKFVPKVDSPELVAAMRQFGAEHYADAEDLNEFHQALEFLYQRGDGATSGRTIKEISTEEHLLIEEDKSAYIVAQPNESGVTVLTLEAGIFERASLITFNKSAGQVYIVGGEGISIIENGVPTDGYVIVKNLGILTKVSNSSDEWIFVDISPAAELPEIDLEYVTNLGGRTPHAMEVYNALDLSTFIKMYPDGTLWAHKGTGFARFGPERLLIAEPSGRSLDYFNGRMTLKSRSDGGSMIFDAANLPYGAYFYVVAPSRPGYSTAILLLDILVNGHPYLVDSNGRVDLGNFEEYFIKNTIPTLPVSGTTASTQYYGEKIKGGTLKIGSVFTIEVLPFKTGIAGGSNFSMFVGDTASELSFPRIIGSFNRGVTNNYQPFSRVIQVISATKIRIFQWNTNAANDKNQAVSNWEDRDFFCAIDQYINVTGALLNPGDSLGFNHIIIKGVR